MKRRAKGMLVSYDLRCHQALPAGNTPPKKKERRKWRTRSAFQPSKRRVLANNRRKKEKRKAISLGVARAGREVPVPIELKTGLQFSRDRDATRRTSHGALVELTQEPLNSLVEQIGHMPA